MLETLPMMIRLPPKLLATARNVGCGGLRKIDDFEQQHHGRCVANQVGQPRCRQSQSGWSVEIESAVRQPLDGLVAVAGGLKSAGDDEQSHEQNKDGPFHQSSKIVGAKLGAGQMNAGGGKDDDFLGQRREKTGR